MIFLKLLQKGNCHIIVKSIIISKKMGENNKTIKEEKTICPNSLKILKNDKPKGDQPPSRWKFTSFNTSHIKVFI